MSKQDAQVAVVIGSDNDREVMQACLARLEEFGIACEVRVLSAHRTPAAMEEFAAGAADRGIRVIIAAAGMSAALAGALAARTTLPVVGVAIPSSPLGGLDALLATVQMPAGVPVGCVGIGRAGAVNAAVLAAEILALADAGLAAKLAEHKSALAELTAQKDRAIQQRPRHQQKGRQKT